jgi:hypothetical protein
MKVVRKVLIVNVGTFLGCILALLLVPDNTPFLLFAACCALAFVAMNVWIFVIPRFRRTDLQNSSKGHSSSSIAWWVIGAMLLADFFLKYGRRLFP